jgi:hypothetical protein
VASEYRLLDGKINSEVYLPLHLAEMHSLDCSLYVDQPENFDLKITQVHQCKQNSRAIKTVFFSRPATKRWSINKQYTPWKYKTHEEQRLVLPSKSTNISSASLFDSAE